MEIKLIVDDALIALIERIVRKVVGETLGASAAPGRGRRGFLCNCRSPDDLLRVVEAPDTGAPHVRDEPHWRIVREIVAGDVILFRDAKETRSIVGHAIATHRERGEHRHQPGVPAIRWWLDGAVRYDAPLSDATFVALFRRHQRGSPGFPLLSKDGRFAFKSYLYPLDDELLGAIGTTVGVPYPSGVAPRRSSPA